MVDWDQGNTNEWRNTPPSVSFPIGTLTAFPTRNNPDIEIVEVRKDTVMSFEIEGKPESVSLEAVILSRTKRHKISQTK